ncbi:MAG: hypothetical protein E7228_03955 [Clostridiales bacterium]|nr:hypothetical protein [Clostridiales bacterium]
MKQLIVLLAVLPFMMIFLMQYTVEQENHYNISLLQQMVYESKEQAKQDGYFTAENISDLKMKISDTFDVGQDEINIITDSIPKYRVNQFDERELIYYKVQVPINRIVAGAGFFGIDEEENKGLYTIESYTASELLEI